MKCPTCGHLEHRVIRTATGAGDVVRRTRECAACLKRWTTIEAPEAAYARARDIAEAFALMKSAIPDEA